MMKNSFLNSEMVFRDSIAHVESHNWLPEKEIEIISKENPELIFTAKYMVEPEDMVYIVEYKNGESREIEQYRVQDE